MELPTTEPIEKSHTKIKGEANTFHEIFLDPVSDFGCAAKKI